MKQLLAIVCIFLAITLAQPASKVLGQPLPLTGATAITSPEERVLRALAVTEGKRCQISEGWSFMQSTPGEYSKLIETSNEIFKKAGWKLESKGQLSQGNANVEAFKLTGAKGELVIGYWLLANNQSQLFWCRLG